MNSSIQINDWVKRPGRRKDEEILGQLIAKIDKTTYITIPYSIYGSNNPWPDYDFIKVSASTKLQFDVMFYPMDCLRKVSLNAF